MDLPWHLAQLLVKSLEKENKMNQQMNEPIGLQLAVLRLRPKKQLKLSAV